MQIEKFEVGPLDTNCYKATCEKTGESIIIDPGGVSNELFENFKNVKSVVLTHGHFDHIIGVEEVLRLTGAPLLIHADDASILNDPFYNGSLYIGGNVTVSNKPNLLSDGDKITFGECSFTVIHTPGHTRGGIVLYDNVNILISGDTLFKQSIGRSDLPGGDYDTLIRSLKKLVSRIPDSAKVYPGHGPSTLMGFEKKNNKFLLEI
jgi:hydroxyacylglutathione hydrolase